MLALDHDEWEALVAVLDAHPGGPVHACPERPEASRRDSESPAWEARHVYGHLKHWINKSMDDFEAVLERRAPPAAPEGSDDEVNARWKEEDADIGFGEARKSAHRAYRRRLQLIRSVPDERWNQPLELIAGADGHERYADHRRYVESATAEPTATTTTQ